MSHALRRVSVLAVATAALVGGAWLAGPTRLPGGYLPAGAPVDGGGGGDGTGDAPGDRDRASRDARQPRPTTTPDGAARSASPPVASPSPSRTAGSTSRPALTGDAATEQRVITIVNEHRSDAGCVPVKLDTRLRTAARGHSADMAAKDYFSHTGADGSSPWDRARRAGHTSPSGENIAMGQRTAEEVMRAWMNSEGHRKNILNCDSKTIGVGLRRNSGGTPYWTQMFGFS